MLGVGLKVTEHAVLSIPLRAYISSNFSKDEVKSVESTLTAIDELRKNVVTAITRQESDHQSSIDTVTEYAEVLQQLTERFPFGDYKTSFFSLKANVAAVKVEWVWYDSFRDNKKLKAIDVNLEKASIIFNLAALYSRQGTKAKRETSGDGLKDACRLFKISASLFEYASTLPSVSLPNESSDLLTDTLKTLSAIMIAQAQACFFEKATSSKISPVLVAKLAIGTAQLFKEAHDMGTRNDIKKFYSKSVYPWAQHAQYQQFCFSAAAHYWRSKAYIAEEKYGLEIAELQIALKFVEDAKKNHGALLSNLVENREQLYKAINTRLQAAVKDNETIYFDTVPDASTLETIEPKPGVEKEKWAWSGKAKLTVFDSLIPAKVHEGIATFNSRLSAYVDKFTRTNQEQHDYAKMHLASLGLPAALEAMDGEKGLPDDLWTQVSEAQQKGGNSAISELNSRVEIAEQAAVEALNKVKATIQQETKEDVEMRQKYGHRWNRRPSEQITTQFKTEMEQIQGFLRSAAESNRKIQGEWKETQSKIEALSETREKIESKLPNIGKVEKSEAAIQLTSLLDDLSRLLDKKMKMMDLLKTTASKCDVKSALLTAKDKTEEQIYSEQFARFAKLEEAVTKAEEEQKELLSKITEVNTEFCKTKEKNSSVKAREMIIQELNVGLNSFNKALANLNEGVNFYATLSKQKIEPLSQRVEDFVFARDMEKRMILDQLTKALAGYTEEEKAPETSSASNPNMTVGSTASAYTPLTAPPTVTSTPPPFSTAPPPASSTSFQPTPSPSTFSQPYAQPFSQPPPMGFTPSPYAPSPYAPSPYAPSPYAQPTSTPYHPVPQPTTFTPIPTPTTTIAKPATTSTVGQWACPACTFLNAKEAAKCGMCGTGQPVVQAQPKKSWW